MILYCSGNDQHVLSSKPPKAVDAQPEQPIEPVTTVSVADNDKPDDQPKILGITEPPMMSIILVRDEDNNDDEGEEEEQEEVGILVVRFFIICSNRVCHCNIIGLTRAPLCVIIMILYMIGLTFGDF